MLTITFSPKLAPASTTATAGYLHFFNTITGGGDFKSTGTGTGSGDLNTTKQKTALMISNLQAPTQAI